MRGLFDDHEREMMMDLTGHNRRVPEMGRSTVHGDSLGSDLTTPAVRRIDRWRLDNAIQCIRGAGQDSARAVAAIYDMAAVEMSQIAPMTLAASEEWVEGDEEYRERLKVPSFIYLLAMKDRTATPLDVFGVSVGLPRARLVPRD